MKELKLNQEAPWAASYLDLVPESIDGVRRQVAAPPTLDQIERLVTNAQRRASDAEATRTAASARTARLAAEEVERDNALKSSLASYFGATSAAFLNDALDAYAPTSPITRPIYDQLRRTDPAIVAEALHCIASTLPFGAPRASDKIIGANAAKAARALPAPVAVDMPPRPQRGPGWFGAWAVTAGAPMPTHPGVDCEAPGQFETRIRSQRDRGLYSQDATTNAQLAARELELMHKRRFDLEEAADADHHAAMEAARLRVVSIVDAVLAEMPFGPAYWWTREIRRVLANERMLMPPHPSVPGVPFTAWRMTQALGVRFNFGEVSP